MATTTFSCAPTNATDAQFRAWGLALSTAIQAVGFVKTADTGQINWTTVLKPASTTTSQGYEIFRFNDALQATAPLFLRVDYGSGVSSANNIRILASSGISTNGAGVLVSPSVVACIQMYCFAASATQFNCYVSSGDGSMLGICLWQNGTASIPVAAVVERSRNASGAASGNSVVATNYLFLSGTQQGITLVVARPDGSWVPNSDFVFWPNSPPALTTGLSSGSSAPMFPMSLVDPNGNWAYPRGLLAYMKPDAAALIPVTVPGYGTYLPLGNAVNDGTFYPGQQSSLAMRWE